MEQRRLRLGDIVDDYCPRERRLSNHLVVAMIGDEVKQTRCTTCDAEHAFKHGKVPARRKRAETASPVPAPATSVAGKLTADPEPAAVDAEAVAARPDPVLRAPRTAPAAEKPAPPAPPPADVESEEPLVASGDAPDEGPFHRRLIRATLPRREGDVPTRPLPDFTLRLPGARVGPFRNGDNRNAQRQFQGNWIGQPGNTKSNRGPGKDRPGRPKGGHGNRPGAFANTGNGGRNQQGRSGNKKRSR